MLSLHNFDNLIHVNWEDFSWNHHSLENGKKPKSWATVNRDEVVSLISKRLSVSAEFTYIEFGKVSPEDMERSILTAFILKNNPPKPNQFEVPTFEEFLRNCLIGIRAKNAAERTVYFQVAFALNRESYSEVS